MRIRKKPWADNEFEINDRLINNAERYKGKWSGVFGNENPIHIELGCGKGQFITRKSLKNQQINYIGIERHSNVIVSALRKARESGCGSNLKFINIDVSSLRDYFEPKEVNRIYINFCDPWPNRKKWAKRRLTHKNFLDIYEYLFDDAGEIFFKTDNRELFEFSLNELSDKGWRLKNISLDLHGGSEAVCEEKTEYEEKFMQQQLPIYRLEAYYNKGGRD